MVDPRIDRLPSADKSRSKGSLSGRRESITPKDGSGVNISAQTFTFRELAAPTKNLRPESFIGEGGFGRVYKGRLESTGQVVSVKQLDRNGLQGNREFLVEVLMLRLLHHPNLVNLIGYCADGDQRLLLYDFTLLGSLEDHLHGKLRAAAPLNKDLLLATGRAGAGGAVVEKGEDGGGSGRKRDVDGLEKDDLNKDSDREGAIAEAKMWGAKWRAGQETAGRASVGASIPPTVTARR